MKEVLMSESFLHPSLRQERRELIRKLELGGSFPQIVDPSVLQPGDVLHLVMGLEGHRIKQAVVIEVLLDGVSEQSPNDDQLSRPRLRAITQEIINARSHTNSTKVLEMLGIRDENELRERILNDDWSRLNTAVVEELDLAVIGILPLNPGADKSNARWNPYCHGSYLVAVPYNSDDNGDLASE